MLKQFVPLWYSKVRNVERIESIRFKYISSVVLFQCGSHMGKSRGCILGLYLVGSAEYCLGHGTMSKVKINITELIE